MQEYQARLAARQAARDTLTAADARIAGARLATFFAAVVLALVAWRSALSGWWLVVPVGVFLWLVRHHDRILRARELAIRPRLPPG